MPSAAAYTLVYEPNSADKPSVSEYRNFLEKGDDDTKIAAMRQVLITVLNGDPMPELLMTIIRYVMPSKNKQLKKLLYCYWEICPKYDDEGKLRHEMILVCNAIQHDLQHPNEYIRGNTLRFLNKLKEPELLEPLVPSCRQCLEHRHAYVRKNAVFAIYSIYRASEDLVPDVTELLVDFLAVESDATCRRNAFVCLSHLDRDASLRYIQDQTISSLDPMIQLAFIQFIRKDASGAPDLRPHYLRIVSELLESHNATVVYEAATSLPSLSRSPVAIQSAATKFVDMAVREPDNNVKLIALDRLGELAHENTGVIDDMALDILRALSAPSLDVRKKAIDITMGLVSSKNVDDVVKLLKKELQKTAVSNEEKGADYRQMLIVAIHQCAINFHEVAASVAGLLLDLMGDLNTVTATEVISFVKQVIDKYPDLRSNIVAKLLESLKSVKSGKVYRGSLWILGEYCLDEEDIHAAWRELRESIGEVPIVQEDDKGDVDEEDEKKETGPEGDNTKDNSTKGPKILADGTYASESAFEGEKAAEGLKKAKATKTPLRTLLLSGDFYLGAVLASTLVKLVLRLAEVTTKAELVNALKAEAMLVMVSIVRAGQSSLAKHKIDEDSIDRIMSAVRILSDSDGEGQKAASKAFLEDTKLAFEKQIQASAAESAARKDADKQNEYEQADDSIVFRQLTTKEAETIDVTEEELAKISVGTTQREDLTSRLKKIVQLTGFSDPVYAEAYVKVHQFDVTLDVLLVNQTTNTLRNLTVEFATLGDLKVVDKPTTANVGPHGFHRVQTTIKVTSADTGVIFGNIVYEGHHADESTIVILSDVHVDILDYIKPAVCTEAQFRKMWNEFEWENKISINSSISSLKVYLNQLLDGTNMKNLTPGAVIGEECQFLSANLYSRSTFGEDALANLCIEKSSDGPIVGHVRIRSKGQGLALSLGDKVAAIARNSNQAVVSKV
ncbi:DEKNAAC100922 [Brettanomyces naardenensis]|uniref:Coatomer subunit beta n=1 Tax=Brettanomyces naardenensis TaxID=13370 RepID=A0A448YGS0_BRENA|nr:DEKNAAC100922 [Brettanomyces naardenensis]